MKVRCDNCGWERDEPVMPDACPHCGARYADGESTLREVGVPLPEPDQLTIDDLPATQPPDDGLTSFQRSVAARARR
jgi:hypothetical protein